jgi:general L-amino acid transport system permease protein
MTAPDDACPPTTTRRWPPSLSAAMRKVSARLAASPFDAALSLFILSLGVWAAVPLWQWLIVDAVWSGDAAQCRASHGACWAFIGEKWRFILFGLYPAEEQWRAALAMLILAALPIISAHAMTTQRTGLLRWRGRGLAGAWTGGLALVAALMAGGVAGLAPVPSSSWGGLPLTMILSVVGLVAAFPLGVGLALCRTSGWPTLRWLAIGYIELIRGVPLISVLFMASVMLPLFLPPGLEIDKLLRAQIGIILFAAAYIAEAVRGGLQALAKGQAEAATALGLSYWQRMRLVILPQALGLVIPPLVNTGIGFFKDTSLVIVIGLMDALAAAKASLADPLWRGFYREAYLFVGLVYFVCCFALSRYSRHLETIINQRRRA